MLGSVPAALEQRLAAAVGEAEALRQEAQKKLPGADKLRKAIEERESKKETLQKRIHEIEDRIFAAFSTKVTVTPDISGCSISEVPETVTMEVPAPSDALWLVAQVGVDNIREYMEQNAAATEEFNKRRMSLTSQVCHLYFALFQAW
jgi:chromosome segregation ATPase